MKNKQEFGYLIKLFGNDATENQLHWKFTPKLHPVDQNNYRFLQERQRAEGESFKF